jgi:trigger factor
VEGPPIDQDEIMLKIGSDDTVGAFSENLRGAAPGDVRVFDVTYPDDYAQERLAGKTVNFQATVKGVRKKELPELNDDFAKDLGDFQNLEELRNEVRKSILAEREHHAQEEAKNALIEKLVDLHEFPVPEAYVDRQIETRVRQSLSGLAAEGLDVSQFRPDWTKLKEAQKDKATREVKASLLLGKIAERESIAAMRDEVDREVERMAKQMREPVAALKIKMEKDGSLNRIASHIQTQKVLTFLFEKARKEAPAE